MNSTPRPAAVFGRMGSHLAVSLGIALAIAGAISLPKILRTAGQGGASAPVTLPLATSAEGKFIDRLSFVAGEDRVGERTFTPAVLAMPMAASWPERGAFVSTAAPSAAIRLRTAAVNLTPLPPRRDLALADGRLAAAPLQILPMVDMPPPAETRDEAGWTRIVTAPAEKVANVVVGTAEMAQAAGSWTLSQASGLLPRW